MFQTSSIVVKLLPSWPRNQGQNKKNIENNDGTGVSRNMPHPDVSRQHVNKLQVKIIKLKVRDGEKKEETVTISSHQHASICNLTPSTINT